MNVGLSKPNCVEGKGWVTGKSVLNTLCADIYAQEHIHHLSFSAIFEFYSPEVYMIQCRDSG